MDRSQPYTTRDHYQMVVGPDGKLTVNQYRLVPVDIKKAMDEMLDEMLEDEEAESYTERLRQQAEERWGA